MVVFPSKCIQNDKKTCQKNLPVNYADLSPVLICHSNFPTCSEMVQKLVYASSVAKYNELYEQLQRDSPREVVAYFNKNWHPIKDEWVLGMKSDCGSVMNFTNNLQSSDQL